jgi:PAS domain S-box-containing protein
MKLRTTTLIIISTTLVGLVGVLYATSSTILFSSIRKAEEQNTRQIVKGVLNVFGQTQNDFSSRFADWSAWDDTATFIQDGNQQYIQANLLPEALTNLKVNLALLMKPSGQIVFGTGFDQNSKQKIPIPEALRSHLTPNDLLLQHSQPKSNHTGILLLPQGPLLVTSQPIVNTKGEGPIRGTIIFGRNLDDEAVHKLSKITRLPLTVYNLNADQMPADFQAVRASWSEKVPIQVHPLNEQTMAGYAVLPDIYGKPALLLRVDISRDIYKQGQSSQRYLMLSVLVVGLIFGGITLLLLEQLVLSRLTRLSADVKQVATSGDPSQQVLVTGQDELSTLASNINKMLEALDQARHQEHAYLLQLQQAEEKYRSIFENATEGIFQTTPDGRFLSANPALATILGYVSSEELIAKVTDVARQIYVEPNRRTEFIAAMQERDAVVELESQAYRKNGSVIWITENVRAVRDAGGALVYYEGTVIDSTVRKVTQEALHYLREQSDRLLLNILPEPIAKRLKLEESTIADNFPAATVLFADIVGFTKLSTQLPPGELVSLLNQIFSAFDELAEYYGLEKIKTIGDAYMVVGGIPITREDHAEAIAEIALDMQQAIADFNLKTGQSFSIRIGINTGPVIAGVIGLKKYIYDLWGDTVNTASRMESHGLPNCTQVTAMTYEILQHKYLFEERGAIQVKGKGEMTTYLLKGRKVVSRGT